MMGYFELELDYQHATEINSNELLKDDYINDK